MDSIKVYIETGKKKTFASAVDWPGWSRGGRDEKAALQAMIDYGPRYVRVLEGTGIEFSPPADVSDFIVTERYEGNSTTDFGAPAIIPDADREPVDSMDYARAVKLLEACWRAFDSAVEGARGVELRKGPRGGGRDLDKMIDHVLDADRSYLARLAWKHKREGGKDPAEDLTRTRKAILSALDIAANGQLPESGPRGGVIWPPPYFVRRVAWHVLDHAWEIEDRIEK